MTAVYITSAIASLKIDSPKIIECKFYSAPISLNTARHATGSVALIKLPNAKESFQLSFGLEILPTAQNIIEEAKIAINVPRKLYAKIVPMFLKKGFFFILYPDSKIIGGSKIIKKRELKLLVKL